MSKKLIELRVELSKRLADAQVIGRSRELSLAVTSIQSARMLFGSVALLLGATNPYPDADKPESAKIHPSADLAADYFPPGQADQIASVKWLRVALQETIDDAVAFRRQQWARVYGTVEEALFDRALVELFLAKQWLGEQLAVIAGHALVKTGGKPEAGNLKPEGGGVVMTDQVIEMIMERLEDSAMLVGSDGRISFGKATEGLTTKGAKDAKLEAPKKIEMANGSSVTFTGDPQPGSELKGMDEAPEVHHEGAEAQRSEEGSGKPEAGDLKPEGDPAADAGSERELDDASIVHRLALGETMTEICRELDVTEHRVKKIRKERTAEIEAAKAKILADAAPKNPEM